MLHMPETMSHIPEILTTKGLWKISSIEPARDSHTTYHYLDSDVVLPFSVIVDENKLGREFINQFVICELYGRNNPDKKLIVLRFRSKEGAAIFRNSLNQSIYNIPSKELTPYQLERML